MKKRRLPIKRKTYRSKFKGHRPVTPPFSWGANTQPGETSPLVNPAKFNWGQIFSSPARFARLFYTGFKSIPIGTWVTLVIIFGMALRLLFPYGLYAWDDFDYSRIAKTIEEGRYSIANYSNWFGHRLPVIYPIGWALKYFGYNEWALMAWPYTASVLNMVFMYFLGKYLFNARAGFFCTLMLALHPLDIKMATILLPAGIYTFLLLGGMTFFVLGEKIRVKPAHWFFRFGLPNLNRASSMFRDYRLLRDLAWLCCWAIAGFLMSQTYYIRAYGPLILGVPAVYMLIRYRISWEYIYMVALGVAAWFAVEFYIAGETGEMFFIYKWLTSRVGPDSYQDDKNVTVFFDFYRNMMSDSKIYSAFTFSFVIFLPIYFWGYKKLTRGKKAALWVPMGFFMFFFIYLEFGVTSIEHMSFLHKLERYIGLITPAYCLVIGKVLGYKLPRWSVWVVCAMLIGLSIYWYQVAGLPPWVESRSIFSFK